MATFDLLLTNVRLATMRDADGYGAIPRWRARHSRRRSSWFGRCARPAARRRPRRTRSMRSAAGRRPVSSIATRISSTPAIAPASSSSGSKARRTRTSLRAGGGIRATVRGDARGRATTTLAAASAPRARAMIDQGVDHRRDQVGLRARHGERAEAAARRAARSAPRSTSTCSTTLLAAHALPPEFADRADAYIDYVCGETIPAAAREGVRGRRRCVLRDDRLHGARRRVACSRRRARTGCRSSCMRTSCRTPKARALAADFGALSADHLEYTNDAGIAAMAKRGDGRRAAARRVLCVARNARAAGRRRCVGIAFRSRSRPIAIPARRPRRRCR